MLVKPSKSGITLIEVMIVTAVIGLLTVVLMTAVYRKNESSYDAARKKDLKNIKLAFEEYYSDHDMYPPTTVFQNYCSNGTGGGDLLEYLDPIPCDSKTGEAYLYLSSNTRTNYKVLAKLSQKSDRDIVALHCDGAAGCGVVDEPDYNYGVSEGVSVSAFLPEEEGGEEPPPSSENECDFGGNEPCYTCVVGDVNICNVCYPGGSESCPPVSYSNPGACEAICN